MILRTAAGVNVVCLVSAMALILTPSTLLAGRTSFASLQSGYADDLPSPRLIVGCDDDDEEEPSDPDISPGIDFEGEGLGDGIGNDQLLFNLQDDQPEKLYYANCPDDETVTDRQLGEKQTQRLLRVLAENEEHCQAISDEYLIDCLAENYARAARQLSKRGEAGEVSQAFKSASRRLKSIVRQTADTTQPRSRQPVRTPSGVKRASKRLTPIRPDAKPAAFAAAARVVEELETVLLTSAENSERRQTYFAEVAQAVTGDKVLLRS